MSSPLRKLTEGLKRVESLSSVLREEEEKEVNTSSYSSFKEKEKEKEKEEKQAIRELLSMIIDPTEKNIKGAAESSLISHTIGLDKNFTQLMCVHEKLVGKGLELKDILHTMESYALQQTVRISSLSSVPISASSSMPTNFNLSHRKQTPVALTFGVHEYPMLFHILLRWRVQLESKNKESIGSCRNKPFASLIQRNVMIVELSHLGSAGDEKGDEDTYESITTCFDSEKNVATLYIQRGIDRDVFNTCLLEACRCLIKEMPAFFSLICQVYHQLTCPRGEELYEPLLQTGQAYLQLPPAISLKFLDMNRIMDALLELLVAD